MAEKKISRNQLNQARRVGNSVYSWFHAYCSCHSSCDTCNPWVRFLCGCKCMIEEWQETIILDVCKEE